ncbi:uncharacterized protein LOC141701253 [Apium graveolens]|uniref:uncharacterized protein LOC141701253 n=1 Tax=Apium graveolens TaxID=4045 RepID=UPI003D7983DA
MYRVLVVDGDEKWRTEICTKLQTYEYYDVKGAKDGREALSMMRAELFDVVLAETHLQDMDGVHLMQQIHKDFKLPVIFITADDRFEVTWNVMKKGAEYVYIKPFEVDDLKEIWQFIEWRRKKIYAQKEKGKQDPNVGVTSDGEYDVSSDDE